jgi:hypothetical protein
MNNFPKTALEGFIIGHRTASIAKNLLSHPQMDFSAFVELLHQNIDSFTNDDAYRSVLKSVSALHTNGSNFSEIVKQMDNDPQVRIWDTDIKESFFDFVMIDHLIHHGGDQDQYFDSPEWEELENNNIERGTELLNLLTYVSECHEFGNEPDLEDFLYEYLMVEDDDFQDDFQFFEPFIEAMDEAESAFPVFVKKLVEKSHDSEISYFLPALGVFFRQPDKVEKTLLQAVHLLANEPMACAVLFSMTTALKGVESLPEQTRLFLTNEQY